jgi:hypothetical protein
MKKSVWSFAAILLAGAAVPAIAQPAPADFLITGGRFIPAMTRRPFMRMW